MSQNKEVAVQAVIEAARTVPAHYFEVYGGGWPDQISVALLDAVFSIRAVYRSDRPGVGVSGRLQAFRAEHAEARDDLAVLHRIGQREIERLMGRTVSAQRRKSAIVVDAAGRFVASGVRTSEDFLACRMSDMKEIYTGVRGLGPVTFEYLTMHLGVPGVKADRMILRFVHRALQTAGLHAVQPAQARCLVIAAHEQTGLGDTLMHFDHGLWRWESDRA